MLSPKCDLSQWCFIFFLCLDLRGEGSGAASPLPNNLFLARAGDKVASPGEKTSFLEGPGTRWVPLQTTRLLKSGMFRFFARRAKKRPTDKTRSTMLPLVLSLSKGRLKAICVRRRF
jgi:hypothetical protein